MFHVGVKHAVTVPYVENKTIVGLQAAQIISMSMSDAYLIFCRIYDSFINTIISILPAGV